MIERARQNPLRRGAGLIMWVSVALVVFALWHDVGGRALAPALIDVHSSTVSAPAGAAVKAVYVRPGEVVAAGDVLLELDPAEIDLELSVARAEIERTRLQVIARAAGIKDQDFELGVRLAVEQEKASLALTSLMASIHQDERELSTLDELVARNEKLVAQKLQSAQTLDELALRRATLRQRVSEAEAERVAAERIEAAASTRLREWRKSHSDDTALTAPDQAAVVAQEARLHEAEWRRERLVLRSPTAGTVATLSVAKGDVVSAGQAVAVVVDVAVVGATAWVGEDVATRVAVGDSAILRSRDGRGLILRGTVTALGGGVLEMPTRLRQLPSEAAFGRAVYIALSPSSPVPSSSSSSSSSSSTPPSEQPLPGQTFDASFERGLR